MYFAVACGFIMHWISSFETQLVLPVLNLERFSCVTVTMPDQYTHLMGKYIFSILFSTSHINCNRY